MWGRRKNVQFQCRDFFCQLIRIPQTLFALKWSSSKKKSFATTRVLRWCSDAKKKDLRERFSIFSAERFCKKSLLMIVQVVWVPSLGDNAQVADEFNSMNEPIFRHVFQISIELNFLLRFSFFEKIFLFFYQHCMLCFSLRWFNTAV